MPISIKLVDERKQKDMPVIDPANFDIESVVKAADIIVGEEEELTIEVVLHNGAEKGDKRTPTSVLEHGHTEELYELEIVDAKSEEVVKVWQKRLVEDTSVWKINVLILPKEELHYKALRALSRAISREIFAISAYRAYGGMMAAIYPTIQDFSQAQTKAADEYPWAVS